MTFTYSLSSTDTDVVNISEVRLEIGDTEHDDGVKPDGSNFADEEIQVWITREGSVMRAAAAACEALSRSWARMANISVGPRSESLSQVAEQYSKQAISLREQFGGGGVTFSAGLERVDGYSGEATGDEYG